MIGDISTPEAVERERRSVTMLATGTPVYDREEALTLLETLAAALALGRFRSSAIGRATTANDEELTNADMRPLERETMKGVRRALGVAPNQKKGIATGDIEAAVAGLRPALAEHRDRLLLTLGFRVPTQRFGRHHRRRRRAGRRGSLLVHLTGPGQRRAHRDRRRRRGPRRHQPVLDLENVPRALANRTPGGRSSSSPTPPPARSWASTPWPKEPAT